jgi:hypothetical protein
MTKLKTWREDVARFKELVLYICEKCASDPKFGATKLNKILYFSDFLAYGEFGQPVTGFEYQKLPNGPAPRHFVQMRDEMVKAGELAIQPVRLVSGRVQDRPVNLRSARLEVFTPNQISLVDAVIDALKDATAEDVSELTHRMVGWKIVDSGETIPYETIFVSDEPLTDADIRRARELDRQLNGR